MGAHCHRWCVAAALCRDPSHVYCLEHMYTVICILMELCRGRCTARKLCSDLSHICILSETYAFCCRSAWKMFVEVRMYV